MITKRNKGLVIRIIFSVLLIVGLDGCAASTQSGSTDKLSSARLVFLVRHTEREWEGEDPRNRYHHKLRQGPLSHGHVESSSSDDAA